MVEFKVLDNDFREIGRVDALTPEDALKKAKSDPKIKRQCLNPMIEEIHPVIQDPRAQMYRQFDVDSGVPF